MLFVKKDNRVLRIDEAEKNGYLLDGYDVIDEVTGEVKEPATGGKVYTPAEIANIKKENEELKKEVTALKKEVTTLKKQVKEAAKNDTDGTAKGTTKKD